MEMWALWGVWKERPDPVRGDMVFDFDDFHPDNARHRKLRISSCTQSCKHLVSVTEYARDDQKREMPPVFFPSET